MFFSQNLPSTKAWDYFDNENIRILKLIIFLKIVSKSRFLLNQPYFLNYQPILANVLCERYSINVTSREKKNPILKLSSVVKNKYNTISVF